MGREWGMGVLIYLFIFYSFFVFFVGGGGSYVI